MQPLVVVQAEEHVIEQATEQVVEQVTSLGIQRLVFWGVLGMITVAELLTSVVQAQAGLVTHALILVGLLIYAGAGRGEEERKLAFALILAPLTRLLSLSLPLLQLPQMAWYPVVSTPLLLATWLIMRQTNTSARAISLRPGCIWLQFLLALGGFGLGVWEYLILRPSLPSMSWDGLTLLWASISLIVFTGFTEEVIFRGLLQAKVLPVFGRWGVMYVSLLFGALHIGYLSITDVVFVSMVGLVFGYIVHLGGSLLGVTLAHGLTNITLFVIMPYLMTQTLSSRTPLIIGMSIIGIVAFLISIAGLLYQARNSQRTTPPDTMSPIYVLST